MRLILLALAISGCSSLQSRLDDAPAYAETSQVSVAAFQSCFVTATADQHVSWLPRGTGGVFTATAGPQNYVMWAVTIDDLGSTRRIEAHSVGPSGRLQGKIDSCLP